MKKVLSLLLSLSIMMILFSACANETGQNNSNSGADHGVFQTPEPTPTPKQTPKPTQKPSVPTTTAEPAAAPTATPQPTKVPLTSDQLQLASAFLNDIANNGFLQCSYSKPAEINLAMALYTGAGIDQRGITREEEQAYTQQTGYSIETDITKLTTAQINDILRKKAGISLRDITTPFRWVYLKAYDAYYYQHGDTNYSPVKCVSGYQLGNTVVIDCTGSFLDTDKIRTSCTVTLKIVGSDSHFNFYSNVFH